ncbi:MAG: DUF3604 domain-containing protein [Alphaproteobacteria bacterium]|nr:DUF3604 domain-containing protein [Alphaproteobacteria bacterium]
MYRIAIGVAAVVVLLAGAAGFVLTGFAYGWFGTLNGPGTIEGEAVPATVIGERMAQTTRIAGSLQAPSTKQILFGDFHVHSTYSLDAYQISLPFASGEGLHPVSDACDYARYCSALDFWSINDHVEGMSSRQWRETKDAIRQCNRVAGDTSSPDLVSFLGWEWTQVGTRPDNHYGHKNVILRDLDEDKVPARPIASEAADPALGSLLMGPTPWQRMQLALFSPEGPRERYLDFGAVTAERYSLTTCPKGVPVRDLPPDCMETAGTPAELHGKLNDWGFPALVIPHGTTWGFYTPAGSSYDKQLVGDMYDPNLQKLIEIFSGHGNSEEYRPWRAILIAEDGTMTCPAPSDNYMPSCWRAGEIIEARCTAAGESAETCTARAEEARNNYVTAGLSGFITVPGQTPQDWLDSGQCQDCFLPSFNFRPQTSVQYALALTDFSGEEPRRFTWGFIGSSDNHFSRPGTGYKEINRFENVEGGGTSRPGGFFDPELLRGQPEPVSRPFDRAGTNLSSLQLIEFERQASFFMTGGLVAAHTEGRNREAIWDALQRKEVYATSGDRILLWFDLENGGGGNNRVAMGGQTSLGAAPVFTVRAAGAFKQKPGCPETSVNALSQDRLTALCQGECYNPSNERKLITRIEVVRIRPQATPGEPVDELIEDVWRSFTCEPNPEGCTVSFSDEEFASAGRDTLYYVRAIEEASDAVNGGHLRCERDADGKCVKVHICTKDYRTDREDDCLSPVEERAWSSPIYISYDASAAPAEETTGEGATGEDAAPIDDAAPVDETTP